MAEQNNDRKAEQDMELGDSRILGRSGIRVSRVGFGVHPLGPSRKNLPLEDGAALMCYAYAQGIRFFDTAQFYHTYSYVRRGFEKIRQSAAFDGMPVLSSKSLEEDYQGMTDAIDEAIRETGLDAIDIFLLHQVTPGWQQERAGALQALMDARKAGRVRAIGISSHHQDQILAAAELPELDVVFALYNYTGLGIRNGEAPGSREGMLQALEACRDRGKGIYTMKVFGGGNLTCDYQQAAKHVFFDCAQQIDAAVVGFTDPREVDELQALLRGVLQPDYNPPTDGKKLRVDREDCMGCGTCVRICSSGAMHYSPVDGLAEIDYTRCVSCSYCAIACPERAIVLW